MKKKNEKKILYVVRLEPTISTLTAIRSIQMAKRDSDGYRIRKSKDLLYGIFMSASWTLYIYTVMQNGHSYTFCIYLYGKLIRIQI